MPGAHINGVGSYLPGMREVPSATVLRSRVFVDHMESALAEAGDILIPIREGHYSTGQIAGELGEVLRGTKPGRISPEETTFFKSVGVAIQDLTAAALAYRNAQSMGLGTNIPP